MSAIDTNAPYVVLENLPPTFNEATLDSILRHVPLKGAILTARVIRSKSSNPYGQVFFEQKADAEAAVKVWDQLPIDGSLITAWTGTNPQVRQQLAAAQQNAANRQAAPAAQPSRPQQAVAAGAMTLPAAGSENSRPYPLGNMNLSWLVDFINTFETPQLRSVAMCTVHECLMSAALSMRSDPVMEHAVMHFYTRFTPTAWAKASSVFPDNGVSFELSRQVFEVLGLVKKYPSANAKSKKLLLSLVERVVEDVNKVTATSKVLSMNKAIPEILASVKTAMTTLRNVSQQFDSGNGSASEIETAHRSLLSWLRFLFSCSSTQHQQLANFSDTAQLEPCSDDCGCSKRFNLTTGFLGDAEVAKIYDLIITFVGSSSRDLNSDLTIVLTALIRENEESYCYRIAKTLHNGDFMMMRWRVFEALVLSTENIPFDFVTRQFDFFRRLESILLQLCDWVRSKHPSLQSVLNLAENAQMCLYDLRAMAHGEVSGAQQLYTLQFDLMQIFNTLADPQYQLCVHVVPKKRDGDPYQDAKDAAEAALRWTAPTKCANARCTNPNPDLKKCSGCKVVFYCSEACQRADWQTHKVQCKDLSRRGRSPPTIGSSGQPFGLREKGRCANDACPNSTQDSSIRCPACKEVAYCSSACQMVDSAHHRTACQAASAAAAAKTLAADQSAFGKPPGSTNIQRFRRHVPRGSGGYFAA